MNEEIVYIRGDIARAQESMVKGLIAFSVIVVALVIVATLTSTRELYGIAVGFCVTLGGFVGWQNRLILRGGEYIRKAQAPAPVEYMKWEEYVASLRGKDPIVWFIVGALFGPGVVFVTSIILIWKMSF